jgi:hypothetical protein
MNSGSLSTLLKNTPTVGGMGSVLQKRRRLFQPGAYDTCGIVLHPVSQKQARRENDYER